MFIHRKSLAFSFITHLALFLFLYLYFLYKAPPVPFLPQKRVITLKVEKKTMANEMIETEIPPEIIPVEIPPRIPEKKPEPQKEKPVEIDKTELVKETVPEKDSIAEKTAEKPDIETAEEIISPREEIHDFRGNAFSYSHNDAPLFTPAEELLIPPADDILLDDLLIIEEEDQEGVDSLYSIELTNTDNRRIMEVPDLVFDMKDPVLGTLSDCRIGFTVTEEGLVRNIHIIPPGTGSETYDEILENIVSRFLFTPGDMDRGVIAINFSRIGGD